MNIFKLNFIVDAVVFTTHITLTRIILGSLTEDIIVAAIKIPLDETVGRYVEVSPKLEA